MTALRRAGRARRVVAYGRASRAFSSQPDLARRAVGASL